MRYRRLQETFVSSPKVSNCVRKGLKCVSYVPGGGGPGRLQVGVEQQVAAEKQAAAQAAQERMLKAKTKQNT